MGHSKLCFRGLAFVDSWAAYMFMCVPVKQTVGSSLWISQLDVFCVYVCNNILCVCVCVEVDCIYYADLGEPCAINKTGLQCARWRNNLSDTMERERERERLNERQVTVGRKGEAKEREGRGNDGAGVILLRAAACMFQSLSSLPPGLYACSPLTCGCRQRGLGLVWNMS